MAPTDPTLASQYDVVIVGAGPAGLSAAIHLKKLGISDIIVLERADTAGGNPRFCGHSPFGMREFKRIYLGPHYARKLVSAAHEHGVTILLNTSVIHLAKNGQLTISNLNGIKQIHAKRVILSTGIRETPRAPRFVSGNRTKGIINTGALQSMVYSGQKAPFKSPVIVGSELVAFSALETCRKAGIKPVVLIEEGQRIASYKPLQLFPKALGIKVLTKVTLDEITGEHVVTGVNILDAKGNKTFIVCDGVIFTGKFLPEASLARSAGMRIDSNTQGPVVDQFGRCSDPAYFATGNLLRPVETAGWCWSEGKQTASYVKQSLEEGLPERDSCFPVEIKSENIRYVVPQMISFSPDHTSSHGTQYGQLRVDTHGGRCKLSLAVNNTELVSKTLNKFAEQRVIFPLPDFSNVTGQKDLIIKCMLKLR